MACTERERRYKFPLLSIEDAVDASRAMFGAHFMLNEEDLKRPQPRRMKQFYSAVLISTLGVSQEQLEQPQLRATDHLDNPDIFEDGLSLVTFTMSLQRFMFACGVADFTVMDIIQPKPKKTQKCISAISNFLKFKGHRNQVYEDAITSVDAVVEQRNQLINRNQELQKRIEVHRAKRAEEQQRVQQIQPEADELIAEVNEMNKKQAAEGKEIHALKTSNAECTAKMAELKVNLTSLKEENENLKSKVVHSPERFKGEITRLSNTVHSLKAAKEERAQRILELSTKQENSQQYTEDVQMALKMILVIGEEMKKQREALSKLEELQDCNTTQRELLRDMTASVQQLKTKIGNKQEKFSRVVRQHDKKISVANEARGESEREQAQFEVEFKQFHAEIDAVQEKQNKLLVMFQQKENLHEKEMEQMQTTYQTLLEALDNYHESLARGWQAVNSALAESGSTK